jgi:hypothetical protein
MPLIRNTPDFDTDAARESTTGGTLLAAVSILLGIPLGVWILSLGVDHRDLGMVLLGLIFLPALVFQAVMSIRMAADGVSVLMRRREWIRGSASALAGIVDRKEEFCEPTYDKNGYYRYSLALEIDTVQTTPIADEHRIWVTVTKRLYKKYARRNTARVYFSPEAPMTFIVEGE